MLLAVFSRRFVDYGVVMKPLFSIIDNLAVVLAMKIAGIVGITKKAAPDLSSNLHGNKTKIEIHKPPFAKLGKVCFLRIAAIRIFRSIGKSGLNPVIRRKVHE